MNAPSRPREVSCLALTFFWDYLDKHQIDKRSLLSQLPYPPDHFDDRLNWIDYPTYLEIETRVGALFPDDPDVFNAIGQGLQHTSGFGFIRVLARTTFSPKSIYSMMSRVIPRFLFPFMTIDIQVTGPHTLQATYHFTAGYSPSQAFIDTVGGILSAVPTMLGFPTAQVTLVERRPLEVVYQIRLSGAHYTHNRARGFGRRLWKRLRIWWKNLDEAALELETANTLLQEKVEALTTAKESLDHRVRDLTLLSRLASTATNDLDLQRLAHATTQVISDARGDIPTVLLLTDGNNRDLLFASTAGIDDEQRRDLEWEVRYNPVFQRITDDEIPRSIQMQGVPWTTIPLRAGGRCLGALLLKTMGTDDLDLSLQHSIGHHLAVAIHNAQTYQMVRDLRDHLEVRVDERTAQLEEARSKLEQAVSDLQAANTAKQTFFTNVSHELKTPLTLILAPLDAYEQRIATRGDPQDREFVNAVRRNARNLHTMVEELLDFSRLDSGRMPVRKQPVDLGLLAADVISTLTPLAKRRRITVQGPAEDDAIHALVDPRLMRRVIVNLVGNAIKYIDEGDTIQVRIEPRGENVHLVVADNGPGIPLEQAEHIFERFHRGWNQGGRVVEGSGIGLAMARDIVTLHEGTLSLDTRPGHGATFTVSVPVGDTSAIPAPELERIATSSGEQRTRVELALLAEADDEDIEDPITADAANEAGLKTILLVEDNTEMRAFLERILRREFRVMLARDGQAGLERALQQRPDLILSDVSMPRMDGLELCRRLKNEPLTRNIPVILVSARPGGSAALEGFEAGADDYIVKPFSSPELIARVKAQIRIRSLTLALIRSEKQASLGMMAAGIAHEVLNPVNVVINATGILRRVVASAVGDDAAQAASSEQMITLVENAGRRIQKVVNGVLTLARRDERELALEAAVLSERVDAIIDLLGHRFKGKVHIVRDHADDQPLLCYADLLDQVITNLLVNAIDAMEPEGGTIQIRSQRTGDEVIIRVHDDGPGIPPERVDRIFNPFFTTKPPGKGTGLGLAMSQEIIDLHRGRLVLEPSDRGACFAIHIPLLDPASDPHDQPDSALPTREEDLVA